MNNIPHGRQHALRSAVAGTFALLLVACSGKQDSTAATEPTAATTCSLDGMMLSDFPGPKGQIRYDKGDPDYFCDTLEMLSLYLRPEQRKNVVAVYTQDMAQAEWKTPKGHWIDARTAFYVFGSDMHGSMGPTAASFARIEDAQAFAKSHGGKMVRFAEITPEMVTLDGGVLRDKGM